MYIKEFNKELENNTFPKVIRHASKGIYIANDQRILMIFSSVNEDYKFPGGGLLENESFEDALIREMREECGVDIVSVGECFAKTIEHKPQSSLFTTMISYYYFCDIGTERHSLKLDGYEEKLRYEPEYVAIKKAVKHNNALIQKRGNIPYWIVRDTYILEMLMNKYI